jgi:hypothetical protein
MITVHSVEQGSEEWHRAREGKFTGASAYRLLKYGTTEYAKTTSGNFGGNFYTKRGHLLEDEAIELYEKIRHCHVDRPGYVTNDHFPDCLFSPDGIADGILIECKAFNSAKHLQMSGGDIPFAVLAQIHFGMLICELKAAQLIIYNPELEVNYAFKIIEIPYNPKIQRNFERALGKETNAVHA